MDEPERCDGCGKNGNWYPLYEGDEYRGYVIPEGKLLCGDCAKEQNVHTADDMSDAELIAAIVDHSHGYATPRHAAFHVRDYREGETDVHCERGHAVFSGDLADLIEAARRHWCVISEEKQQELLERVERWQELENEDRIASLGLSMSYPTLA